MITRGDLADIGDENYCKRQGEFMLCRQCTTQFGGTQGDYWQIKMGDVLQCPECGSTDIALVRTITTIEVIRE